MKTPTAETAFPPAERGQHDAIEHVKDAVTGAEVFRIREVTQIDKYWGRGLLGKTEEADILREVGNEYGGHVYVGCLGPRYASVNLLRVTAGPGDGTKQQESAEIIAKTDEKLGATSASIMRAVCAEGYTANGWAIERARQNGWGKPNGHFGMMMLIEALRQTRQIWGR